MSLIPLNTSNGLAVSDYLSNARDWLATAVEMTGPATIAAAKAEITTAAEATKQLGLSKEIQLDAVEMVRRAEFAVGRAIRKGQDEGTIRKPGEITIAYGKGEAPVVTINSKKASPTDFAPAHELTGQGGLGNGIYAMADEASVAEFDAAIAAAKEEGNLSRANVVRKIRQKDSGCAPRPLKQRVDEIESLAGKGATSDQIASELGTTSEMVRRIARENGIAIRADEVRGTRIRRNYDRVLDNVIEAVEVAVMSLRDIDPASLDKETALERLDSLTSSIKELGSSAKKIKESFHEQG